MPTLIGDGGHATDIWDSISWEWRKEWRQVAHHDNYTDDGESVLIGINDPNLRLEVAEKLGKQDMTWFHPHAYLGTDSSWGVGTHINYGVTMTRTSIGHHTTIAPGVTICGDVTIGDRVFIGAGAIIVNLTNIPDDTFVKAGSLWTTR